MIESVLLFFTVIVFLLAGYPVAFTLALRSPWLEWPYCLLVLG